MNVKSLLVALALACGCAGQPVRSEIVADGSLRDVLSGDVRLYSVLGGSPAAIAVSDPDDIDLLLSSRSALASSSPDGRLICIVDVSAQNELARAAVADRLVESALDEGGPLLLDAEGRIARDLTGAVARPALVRLGAEGEVLERAPLANAPAK